MKAFHGFLRIDEITMLLSVLIENLIQLNDLKTVSGQNKTSMQLAIRHYKDQPNDRPVIFEIDS